MRKHECKVTVKGTKKEFVVSKAHYEANKDNYTLVAGGEKMEKPEIKNKMAKPKATK